MDHYRRKFHFSGFGFRLLCALAAGEEKYPKHQETDIGFLVDFSDPELRWQKVTEMFPTERIPTIFFVSTGLGFPNGDDKN